jgi:hypothetical protein
MVSQMVTIALGQQARVKCDHLPGMAPAGKAAGSRGRETAGGIAA